jgi:head-tail adaptor
MLDGMLDKLVDIIRVTTVQDVEGGEVSTDLVEDVMVPCAIQPRSSSKVVEAGQRTMRQTHAIYLDGHRNLTDRHRLVYRGQYQHPRPFPGSIRDRRFAVLSAIDPSEAGLFVEVSAVEYDSGNPS